MGHKSDGSTPPLVRRVARHTSHSQACVCSLFRHEEGEEEIRSRRREGGGREERRLFEETVEVW